MILPMKPLQLHYIRKFRNKKTECPKILQYINKSDPPPPLFACNIATSKSKSDVTSYLSRLSPILTIKPPHIQFIGYGLSPRKSMNFSFYKTYTT